MNKLSINIGLAIEQRVNELGISKSELARRLGIAQQNVNKVVFSKESLDTAKLWEICKALDYNFFELYVNASPKTTALLDTVKLQSFINDNGCDNISFASKLGITRSEFEAILNGGDLSLHLVERMAEALGVQPIELIKDASNTADGKDKLSEIERENIALKAENKLLRELQGLSERRQANVG